MTAACDICGGTGTIIAALSKRQVACPACAPPPPAMTADESPAQRIARSLGQRIAAALMAEGPYTYCMVIFTAGGPCAYIGNVDPLSAQQGMQHFVTQLAAYTTEDE